MFLESASSICGFILAPERSVSREGCTCGQHLLAELNCKALLHPVPTIPTKNVFTCYRVPQILSFFRVLRRYAVGIVVVVLASVLLIVGLLLGSPKENDIPERNQSTTIDDNTTASALISTLEG
ncbi:uncharacterized protein LOC144144197 isoform X2 [Haemaphysalis longicornis]